jgi:hypothetical protein
MTQVSVQMVDINSKVKFLWVIVPLEFCMLDFVEFISYCISDATKREKY